MERLSAKKKVAIVRQYLSGRSYGEIAAKSGVSKGTVSNMVADLKAGRFPEAEDVVDQIELLRELSLDLKQSRLSPSQCAIGLTVLTRISECGLDLADIDRWSPILKSAGGEAEVQEFVSMMYSIQEVQKRTGLSLEELDNKVHELERKASDLEPMSRRHEDYTGQLAELTKQRENLISTVAGLEDKYKLLNPRVKDLENRERDLSSRIRNMEVKAEKAEVTIATLNKERQRLLGIGLSFEALGELSQRVHVIAQRHHISPAELQERLLQELENLSEGLRLETLIQTRQAELQEQEQTLALARQDSETLKAVADSLKQEKASLEASIKNTREKVSTEIAKIIPAGRDAINGVVDEFQRGYKEVLADVCRLRNEALEVGIEVGRYKEMLQSNQWLSDLLALVRGEETVKGKRVRVIILLILRGVLAWLMHNEPSNLQFSTLPSSIRNLIGELEKWKA